jgi:hypothetical protein
VDTVGHWDFSSTLTNDPLTFPRRIEEYLQDQPDGVLFVHLNTEKFTSLQTALETVNTCLAINDPLLLKIIVSWPRTESDQRYFASMFHDKEIERKSMLPVNLKYPVQSYQVVNGEIIPNIVE